MAGGTVEVQKPWFPVPNSNTHLRKRYGRIIGLLQKIEPKRPKLDGPAYEYAQNKMAGVHVRRKIISRRAV